METRKFVISWSSIANVIAREVCCNKNIMLEARNEENQFFDTKALFCEQKLSMSCFFWLLRIFRAGSMSSDIQSLCTPIWP